MQYIDSMTEEELKALAVEMGEKSFRGTQVFEGIHRGRCTSVLDIQNIPLKFREALSSQGDVRKVEIIKEYRSKLDETVKMLYKLYDGNIIEGVLMKYEHGHSLCISTQVGCRMGCSFCASTKEGLVRNLAPYEMAAQVYEVEKKFNVTISNIILMGSGEPLDNYDNVIKFIKLITSPKGKNISIRSITISTSGLADKIYDLADENLKVGLAISLHSSNDEYRREIMPVAKKYSVAEIVKAAKYFSEKNSSRITFEYTVIDGKNNRDEDVKNLKSLFKNIKAHVNLIPLNPVIGFDERKPERKALEEFEKKLINSGINTTIRRTLGADIDASCGQLKIKHLNNEVLF